MESRLIFSRRLLLVCVAVTVSVALALALGVIPPVKAEVERGATPEMVVLAFWVNIGLNLLAALALFLIASRSTGLRWISRSGLVVVGLGVLLLGFALADAGSAYQSHGAPMQSASRLLIICAVADLLAGVLVFLAALRFPKKLE
jgi:hypothetical protein